LLNNYSLETLNLTDNQGGDRMAETLAKVFQHNSTLKTVYWDSNEVTLSGLKVIRLGLQRNKSITYMPLPLLDISAILKNTNIDTQQITVEITEVQNAILKIVSSRTTPSSSTTSAPTISSTTEGSIVSSSASEKDVPTISAPAGINPQTLTGRKLSGMPSPNVGKKRKATVDMVKASRLFGVQGAGNEDDEDASTEQLAPLPPSTPSTTFSTSTTNTLPSVSSVTSASNQAAHHPSAAVALAAPPPPSTPAPPKEDVEPAENVSETSSADASKASSTSTSTKPKKKQVVTGMNKSSKRRTQAVTTSVPEEHKPDNAAEDT